MEIEQITTRNRGFQEWAKSPVSMDGVDVIKCPTVFHRIAARKNLVFAPTWILQKISELKEEIGPGSSRAKRVATAGDPALHKSTVGQDEFQTSILKFVIVVRIASLIVLPITSRR
jgi:hypothetical protein